MNCEIKVSFNVIKYLVIIRNHSVIIFLVKTHHTTYALTFRQLNHSDLKTNQQETIMQSSSRAAKAHFRVALSLHFKPRPDAKPFIWIRFLSHANKKTKSNSEMSHCSLLTLVTGNKKQMKERKKIRKRGETF